MVTTFYPPFNFGGDGIAIQRLSRALARRGHQVVVVHDVDAYNALHTGPEPAVESEPQGVEVVGLRSGLGALSPILTHQVGRPVVNSARIARVLDGGSFDVMVFNNISLVGGPGIIARGGGIKLYEAHEHWLVCPTHVLWRHDREPCTGRQCLRCVAHYHRPPQLWRYTGMLGRYLREVDAFIAKSEFSREKHKEFGFEHPMHVIPYFLPNVGGANAESRTAALADATAPGQRPHARPYFLYVGRLERIKGLDDVIPAVARYPDADLLIAGDGTHGDTLRALATAAPNVKFLGRLSASMLRSYYEHALALIVPSIGFETFGIIVIESLREGTPVIARRVGPFPELVSASGGGLLFTQMDELIAHMRSIQTRPQLRATLGQSGREAFLRMWTEDAVVPRYLELIREVAERKGLTKVVDQIMESAA
jgi:glycosyltransferase involved in cell wall biosynthesis